MCSVPVLCPGCKIRAADPDQCDLDIYGNGSMVALDIGSSHVFHMHTEHFQVGVHMLFTSRQQQ